jgi:hypothetical protein
MLGNWLKLKQIKFCITQNKIVYYRWIVNCISFGIITDDDL